jgi:hypothetical protein
VEAIKRGLGVQVFLSYRRDDSSGHAGRLDDALVQQFGPRSVFQDVAAIGPGRDFTAAIARALEECEAVLVVIGPEWLGVPGPSGKTRLHEPDDYVHLELATALSFDVPVVPVLVGGANLPTVSELPDDLSQLAHRQAVVLHDETWHRDVDGLVRSLRGESQLPVPRRRRWLMPGVAALGVVAVLAGGVLLLNSGTDDGGSEPEVCLDPAGPQFTPLEFLGQPTGEIMQEGGTLQVSIEGGGYRELAPGSWEVVLSTAMTNLTASAVTHGDWHYDGLAVDGREFNRSCFAPEKVLNPNLTSDARIGFEVMRDPSGVLALLLEGDIIDLTS